MKIVSDELRTERLKANKYKDLYDAILSGKTVWESDVLVNYNSVVVGFRHADHSEWRLRTHQHDENGVKGHVYWVEAR